MCNNALHLSTFAKITVACFVGTEIFLIIYSNGHNKLTSPIKDVPRLFLTKQQATITEMYPRNPWQLVADPLGSAKRTWEPLT